MPAAPPRPDDPLALRALDAARRARATAGDDAFDGEARTDAFAALLYGLALGVEMSRPEGAGAAAEPLAERVGTLAVLLVRDTMSVSLREATRIVEAIGEAIAADEPEPAVQAMVHDGVGAAADWRAGALGAFDVRIVRATAGEGVASARPLRPR